VGKRADVIVVNLNQPHSSPRSANLASVLVYAAQATDVSATIIDGQLLMNDRRLTTLDEREVVADADRECKLLLERSGLGAVNN
jgi:5-methylthioadenosine/S-adenosylhomocysteine deaminase